MQFDMINVCIVLFAKRNTQYIH